MGHTWLASLCAINSLREATLYLHSQLVVGLQHFVLRLVEGVLQPPLQHLDKGAGVDVICRADEPQDCGGEWKGKKKSFEDVLNFFFIEPKKNHFVFD